MRLSMSTLQSFASQWADLATLAGLVVSLLGFGLTIRGVWIAKTASEAARDAVTAAAKTLAHHDMIADLSSATVIMDEIKRLQRHGSWAILPDRYSELRRRLVAIK